MVRWWGVNPTSHCGALATRSRCLDPPCLERSVPGPVPGVTLLTTAV